MAAYRSPDHGALLIGHEDGGIVAIELRTEEPGVALLRCVARRKEAQPIELVVLTHQRSAEAAERGDV